MAYTSWSVVYGEQPSAAKWNILGTNDASFNDGTGIANMALSTTSISNPYKFRAYRSANFTSTSGADTKVPLNSEVFDTNNNFDSTTNYRYTAPVSGFYWFHGSVVITTLNGYLQSSIWVSGVKNMSGNVIYRTGAPQTHASTVGALIQLTAGQYVELYYYIDTALTVAGGSTNTHLLGFLVSQT